MRRRLDLSAEHGFSMVAVVLVLLATSMLAGATFAAVGADIPFARAAQDRKQAYAAAEGGVEYYLYQLARDNDYWTHCTDVEDPGDGEVSPVNQQAPSAATRTWRKVSGTSDARFSIELLPANGATSCDSTQAEDTMLDHSSGTFRIRATGESRGVRRSIISTLRRTSFLDYLYFTDYESSDPLSFPSAADQLRAARDCVKYRIPREADAWCKTNTKITFQDWDAIHGPLHTNDDLLTCATPDFGRSGKLDRIEIAGPQPNGYRVDDGCGGAPKFWGPVRQPAQNLPVPESNDRLRNVAASDYVFEGMTEITFDGTSNMTVVTYPNGVRTSTTKSLPANGVIYVATADGPPCTLDAPRQIDYPAIDSDNWRCAVLTVHGTYPKSMTLGSESDILIDDDLKASGDVVLGLIAKRFVRVKHDVSGDCGSNVSGGYNSNITIEAAMLALKDSVIVDNYPCGNALGNLSVKGAIAQKFRGPVGTFSGSTRTHGYAKDYWYDDRLRYRSPPYFLDPVVAAWRVVRNNEQAPAAK